MTEVIALLKNAAMLFSMVSFFNIINNDKLEKMPLFREAVYSSVYGMFGVLVMATPVVLGDAVVADARMLVVFLSAYLYNYRIAFITVSILGVYQYSINAPGNEAAILSLVVAYLYGILIRRLSPFSNEQDVSFWWSFKVGVGLLVVTSASMYFSLSTPVDLFLVYVTVPAFGFIYPVFLYATLQVIVDQRKEDRAFRQLAISNDRFRQIIDDDNRCIIVLELDGRVVQSNSFFYRFLQKTEKEVIGNDFIELMKEAGFQTTYDEMRVRFNEAVNLKARTFLQCQITRRDGANYYMDTSFKPVFGEDERVIYVIVDSYNIYEKIERMEEVLFRQFMPGISHYMRTPITVFVTSVHLLKNYIERGDDEGIKRHITNLEERADDLVKTVNNLAALRGRYDFRVFDIRDALTGVYMNILELPGTAHMNLAMPDEPIYINGDIIALKRALENVVENSKQYTPLNGLVQIRLYSDDDWAYLIVKDDGAGMDQNEAQAIFEEFYRSNKGKGLGMLISKRVILGHNGDILVHSKKGEGTIFTIKLPLQKSGSGSNSLMLLQDI